MYYCTDKKLPGHWISGGQPVGDPASPDAVALLALLAFPSMPHHMPLHAPGHQMPGIPPTHQPHFPQIVDIHHGACQPDDVRAPFAFLATSYKLHSAKNLGGS